MRYSILQAASGSYILTRIGSHREVTREQAGWKSAFIGTLSECFAHLEANRAQFPVDRHNGEA